MHPRDPRSTPRLPAMLFAALLLAGCGTTDVVEAGKNPSFYSNVAKGGAVDPQAAADMISDYRKGRGLPTVSVDPVLMQVAQRQAKAMAAADQLSHSVGGRTLNARLKAAGFDGLKANENVGAGYHTLAEAFSGWRDSPSHNRNMLAAGMDRLGIAAVAAPNSKYRVYWALVLGQSDPNAGAAAAAAAAARQQGASPAPGETSLTINGMQVPGR